MSGDKSPAITLLRLIGNLLPGNYLKTKFFLLVVGKMRRALRSSLWSFYRMEHVYDILFECKRMYKGNFSILEFGTNEGYAFTKILYATKYTKMEERGKRLKRDVLFAARLLVHGTPLRYLSGGTDNGTNRYCDHFTGCPAFHGRLRGHRCWCRSWSRRVHLGQRRIDPLLRQ